MGEEQTTEAPIAQHAAAKQDAGKLFIASAAAFLIVIGTRGPPAPK